MKFSMVGLLNTGIHYGVFLLLLKVGELDYLVSSGIGYCFGLVNSYSINRKWTFAAAQPCNKLEFIQFACVNAMSLGLNLLSLKIFVSFLSIIPEIAQIIAIIFSMLVNFFCNKFWIFNIR